MPRRSIRDPEEALRQAQDLAYDAWDAPTAARRQALARAALAKSPNCADAYVVLARDAAAGSDEELDLWRRGVEAGAAAVGAGGFAEFAGAFWGFLETRPYMRARLGLALALWHRGAVEEAIEHARAMLELNPDDNQGIRYLLAIWLVTLDRDADLAALLDAYPEDDSSDWVWNRAIAAFRRVGATGASRAALDRALAENPHVAPYLLGRTRLPARRAALIQPGGRDEAAEYARRAREAWRRAPGALAWLAAAAPAAAAPAAGGRSPRREPSR